MYPTRRDRAENEYRFVTSLPHTFDLRSFAKELDALRAEAEASLSKEDFDHLRKIERWGKLCTALGYATAWIAPNPVSALLLSQGTFVRWTMLTHHITHRGYDRVPEVPSQYTSKGFAVGARRWIDWFDWIAPEAWKHEHNVLHHYHTNEEQDPDLVQRNLEFLRRAELPLPLKYALIALGAATWKWLYYAPSTQLAFDHAQQRRAGTRVAPIDYRARYALDTPEGRSAFAKLFDPRTPEGRTLWKQSLLPYGAVHFGLVPLLFLPLGAQASVNVLCNALLAEACTNLHSFCVIVPNHCGDDVFRFEHTYSNRAEFYVHQVLGSVNFHGGTDVQDFLHGWLGYQIEHHLFPDLPMSKYQELQPKVKAICEKYGLPYVQQSIPERVEKLLAIMVGRTSQPTASRFWQTV